MDKQSSHRGIFFHTKVEPLVMDMFNTFGTPYEFKKGKIIPLELLRNNVFLLMDGLLSNTKYISFGSKEKFTIYVLPERLVDVHVILIKEYPACQIVEIMRDSKTIAVPYNTIQMCMQGDYELLKSLHKECATYTRRYMHLAIFLFSQAAEKKIRRFFYDLLVSYQSDFSKEWLSLPIKFTREEIAHANYISEIALHKQINKWYKEGMLRKNDHYVVNKALFENMNTCAMESFNVAACPVYKNY